MDIDQLKKCEEAFELEVSQMGFNLDKVWGTYENPYKEHDAKLAYELFKKGWQAKSQAVPEGFVLLEKKNLRDTYYLVDSEYVVDDPTEYELELEFGEIATLEKWQRTKEIKVFCANIYSDEDNFEVVEFESIEDAEKAIAENKAMLEAQEQNHE